MPSSLPQRPDLSQLRRQAKELRDAVRDHDPAATARVTQALPGRAAGAITLAVAQLVIAREHGFASWPKLKAAVDARGQALGSPVSAFLQASLTGWAGHARRLLAADPGIARASVFAAAVAGEERWLREAVAADPALAVTPDTERGWPPLLYACYSHWHRFDPARNAGLLGVARALLDAGASPDTSNGAPPGGGRGYRGALLGAATVDNPAMVALLLDRGAVICDDPTYPAARHPGSACLRLLLEHGAPVSRTWSIEAAIGARNTGGVRLLLAAAQNESRRIAAILATRALSMAAETGPAELVEALLVAGADPGAQDTEGVTPMQHAVRNGRHELALLLASYGAPDSATNADRLAGACLRGDEALARSLLAADPSGTLLREQAAAIVHTAGAGWGRDPAGVVRLMLDLGFSISARNDLGETPLHTAGYAGNAETVRLLLSRGAEVDALDGRFSATALAFATVGSGEHAGEPGDWDTTVRLLLDAGASHDGVWMADMPPSGEVAEILESYGVPLTGPPPAPAQLPPTQLPAAGQAPPDPELMQEMAEQLTEAYHNLDMDLLRSLLHPEVFWGNGPDACHTSTEVLAWYARLYDNGVRAAVTGAAVDGDTIVLDLAVTGRTGGAPAEPITQWFKVADGAITEISGTGQ